MIPSMDYLADEAARWHVPEQLFPGIPLDLPPPTLVLDTIGGPLPLFLDRYAPPSGYFLIQGGAVKRFRNWPLGIVVASRSACAEVMAVNLARAYRPELPS